MSMVPSTVVSNKTGEGTPYCHSPLLPGSGSIRLLRLMPNPDTKAPIKCELIDYNLESTEGPHLYEALSYVWGDPHDTVPICIGDHTLQVTKNFHSALVHLRNASFQRILWVDAACINQKDDYEKSIQIRYMTKIYGLANRVIVWLGEAADNSDQTLEAIELAAEDDHEDLRELKFDQDDIFLLLERPWFRRIWVSQEELPSPGNKYAENTQ